MAREPRRGKPRRKKITFAEKIFHEEDSSHRARDSSRNQQIDIARPRGGARKNSVKSWKFRQVTFHIPDFYNSAPHMTYQLCILLHVFLASKLG
jgi:hypothetical protein